MEERDQHGRPRTPASYGREAARRVIALARERSISVEAAAHYVAGEHALDREHTERLRRLAVGMRVVGGQAKQRCPLCESDDPAKRLRVVSLFAPGVKKYEDCPSGWHDE